MRRLKIVMKNGICRIEEGQTEIRLSEGDEIIMEVDGSRLAFWLATNIFREGVINE